MAESIIKRDSKTPFVTQQKRTSTISSAGTYTPIEDCFLSLIIKFAGNANTFQGAYIRVGGYNIASFYQKTATAVDISFGFYAKAGVEYSFAANGTFPNSIVISEFQ